MDTSHAQEPLLFTPGPLTTHPSTRAAMMRDFGSRDARFVDLTAEVRAALLEVAAAPSTMSAVPLQGSGTFAVEAMLGTFVRPAQRLLVAANGAYGERMASIAARLRLDGIVLRGEPVQPLDPRVLARRLDEDPSIALVAMVHGETTTGLINPLEEIAEVVRSRGRRLLVDAMSTFGGVPLSLSETPVTALAASANKCLEGAPGMGFVIADTGLLDGARDGAPSLCLDLADQWRAFEASGQWRFTPPTHVVSALAQALRRLRDEGGVESRWARYEANRTRLVAGMRALGFETLLPDRLQGPVIVTFREPAKWPFAALYEALARRGFLLYPGKLTRENTFRIGCIGDIATREIDALLAAIADVQAELRARR